MWGHRLLFWRKGDASSFIWKGGSLFCKKVSNADLEDGKRQAGRLQRKEASSFLPQKRSIPPLKREVLPSRLKRRDLITERK